MADYNSSLTGPEIDAALTRAKSGGEIDTLLDGKAPAGYGIGEEYATPVKDTDLDTLKKGGTYHIGTGCTNTPPNTDSAWSTLHVIPGRACTQIFIPANYVNNAGTFSSWIARIYNNATAAWGEWEWVNPPMALGFEYRTTERYNGKPVYVKAISCGAMPNATTTKVSDEFRATSIISVDGVTSGGTHFPTYSGHTASIGRIDVFVNIYGNIWITTTTDWSNETATIVLKYTKD